MSSLVPANINSPTVVMAVTSTTAAKALGTASGRNLIISNLGSVPVAIKSGKSTVTIAYPTTSAGQNCTTIPAGQTATYRKDAAEDDYVAAITASGTADIHIKLADGV